MRVDQLETGRKYVSDLIRNVWIIFYGIYFSRMSTSINAQELAKNNYITDIRGWQLYRIIYFCQILGHHNLILYDMT